MASSRCSSSSQMIRNPVHLSQIFGSLSLLPQKTKQTKEIDEPLCTKCKKNTQLVYDHSTGDTICCECGLVLESHYVDESSKFGCFSFDVHIGEPSNPLLTHPTLTTFISDQTPDSDCLWESPNPDRTLILGFRTIGKMCDRLDLVDTVKDRANEMYKKIQDHKTFNKGGTKSNVDAILAACLYIACAEEHKPRTLKEICSVSDGVTQKEICLAKKKIAKQFGEDIGSDIHASDFVARFCSPLSLKFRTVKAAQEAVRKWELLGNRRNPASTAAAVIYMVIQLSSDDNRLLHEISTATGIPESAISKAYGDVCPYASSLIPAWYAQEKDLNNLTSRLYNLRLVGECS